MRPEVVVIVAPGFDDCAGFGEAEENVFIEALVAQFAVEASMKAFWTGLPGWM